WVVQSMVMVSRKERADFIGMRLSINSHLYIGADMSSFRQGGTPIVPESAEDFQSAYRVTCFRGGLPA
ncbi:hypothetical protein, partial [Aeromonas enteropelogenes]|uniref:hypothetical protein n=1 Tax=Aeromonas enteropelogenes TaxID=29489 RepID=UPI001C882215